MTTTPPKVVVLEGLNNFDEWVESLKSNLEYLDLQEFVFLRGDRDNDKLLHPPFDTEAFEIWDERRQLAKAIVKQSTVRMTAPMMDVGWNTKSKDPKVHFDAAVAAMVREALATGLVGDLVGDLCDIHRSDCDSLAAYQSRLCTLRRRLGNLGYSPGDKFIVAVAVNGLRGTHGRWHGVLEREMAEGSLDWDALMQRMWSKACRESTNCGRSDPIQLDEE